MDNNIRVNNDQISATNGSKSHGGMRRCRHTEATSSGAGKRRKFDSQHHDSALRPENRCWSGVDVISPEDVVSSSESDTSDHVLSSPCFKNRLSSDLKVELRSDTETSISGDESFSSETSASSEICTDSDKLESSSTMNKQPPRPRPPPAVASRFKPAMAAKTPTAAEIEEFFTVVEKNEHKRFAEKYNFDIVNDVPMDGRYQWVRLKP